MSVYNSSQRKGSKLLQKWVVYERWNSLRETIDLLYDY